MKKFVLFTALFIPTFFVFAQPTITSNVLPVIGDTNQMAVDTNLILAGNGGTNIIWDFINLPTHYLTKRIYLSADSTPYANMFSSATMCRTDAYGYLYSYWNNSSISSYYMGFVQPNIVDQSYNNLPINYYVFPMHYNDAYTDTFSATTNPGGLIGGGRYYFKADGWGTLQLPNQTYPNTLRTKSVMYIGDSTINSYSLTTEYSWFTPNHKEPLMVISKVVVNGALSSKVVLFNNALPNGLSEISASQSVSLFPNPAYQQFQLKLNNNVNANNGSYAVMDITGKTLLTGKIQSTQTSIDISNLNAGTYYVALTLQDQVIYKKLVVTK